MGVVPGTKRYRGKGFSLVELLIVMTLITIMLAMSVPYMLRETPGEMTSRGVQDMAYAIRLARYRAITTKREVYFDFEPPGTSDFYTAYVNLGSPGDVPQGTLAEITATNIPGFDDVVGSRRGELLAEGVIFGTGIASSGPSGTSASSALDLPANPVVFEPRGTVAWPGGALVAGTIYLTHADRPKEVRAITIARSGVVKVWSLKNGTWR